MAFKFITAEEALNSFITTTMSDSADLPQQELPK